MRKLIIFLMLCASMVSWSLAQTQIYELVESSRKDTFIRKVENVPHEKIILTNIKIENGVGGVQYSHAIKAIRTPGKPYITKIVSHWIYDRWGLTRYKHNVAKPIIYDINNYVHVVDDKSWDEPKCFAWETILLWFITLISGMFLTTWFIKQYIKQYWNPVFYTALVTIIYFSFVPWIVGNVLTMIPVFFGVAYAGCIVVSIFLKPWYKIAGFMIVANISWFAGIGATSGQWLPLVVAVGAGVLGILTKILYGKINNLKTKN